MPKPVNITQPKASYRYGYGMMGAGQHAGQKYAVVPVGSNGAPIGQPGHAAATNQPIAGTHKQNTEFGTEATYKGTQQAAGTNAPGPTVAPPQAGAAKSNSETVPNAPNSTQNSLQIAEIRDGIVIMSDGSFRSVVMCKAINFDLMSQSEQESIEYAYQGFLNSLYFPVQIFIRSQKVDLQPYIEKLDKIRAEHDNMLLALLMEDYIGYIDSLSQETNIMDKKFYLVVPFASGQEGEKALMSGKGFVEGLANLFTTKQTKVVISEAQLEKAKTELRNRVQAVMQGLMQCNIKSLPLDTQELIELYYDMYNPDTAVRQQIKNFDDLTAEMITKGEGVAPQAHLQGEAA